MRVLAFLDGRVLWGERKPVRDDNIKRKKEAGL